MELVDGHCRKCLPNLTSEQLIKLKAATYDSIIKHLFDASDDERSRERARCKIAKRNIKRWAEQNLEELD
jgi:hypothetical protein